MSVRVMTWVWDSKLPSTEKLIALAYADHADDQGNNIYPSLNTVARKASISRRRVISIRQRLEERGVLVATRTIHNKPTRFRMDKTALEAVTSDAVSLVDTNELVTLCHPASDAVSLELVTLCHPASDAVSPNPSINHQNEPSLNHQEESFALSSPAPVNLDSVVPDALKNQKAPPRKPRTPKFSPVNITQSDDPRVQAYLEIIRNEITTTNAMMICERVELEHCELWRQVLIIYALGEYPATRFEWMFERYERAVKAAEVRAANPQATKAGSLRNARTGKTSARLPQVIHTSESRAAAEERARERLAKRKAERQAVPA